MRCKSKADMWVKEYRAKQRKELIGLIINFWRKGEIVFDFKLNSKALKFKISIKSLVMASLAVLLVLSFLLVKCLCGL